jgi:hypothetical protein
MRTRGRISAVEKATVVEGLFGKRPEPPEELNERQTEIWREVVASENPKFFETAATRGLLADYCRHREAGEKISAAIDLFKVEWLRSAAGLSRYHSLLRARDLETRAAMAAARSLRITNQARYRANAADVIARHAAKAKPWEL